jgi:hypothetical protein
MSDANTLWLCISCGSAAGATFVAICESYIYTACAIAWGWLTIFGLVTYLVSP